MTYSDGVCASSERFPPHISKKAGDLVLVDLVKFRPTMFPRIEDVLPQATPAGSQLLGLRGHPIGLITIDIHSRPR